MNGDLCNNDLRLKLKNETFAVKRVAARKLVIWLSKVKIAIYMYDNLCVFLSRIQFVDMYYLVLFEADNFKMRQSTLLVLHYICIIAVERKRYVNRILNKLC